MTKKKDCMNCSAETCQCIKFDCVCKSRNCSCRCAACKPKLFSFPKDLAELENWKRACPNVFSNDKKQLKACEWHWPTNYDTVTPTKNPHLCSSRPKDPPSIFYNIPVSCSRAGTSLPRPTSRATSQIGDVGPCRCLANVF